MLPNLFEIAGFKVPSYPVMMVLGYLLALGIVYRLAGRREVDGDGGLNRPQVWDFFIVLVVASILGAKMGHVLFEANGHAGVDGVFDLLRQDPWHPLRLDEPGYVWYGGMLAALGVAAFYFWRRPHLNAWLIADAFAPATMVGAVAGRTGCFLAGCCYGVSTDQPWGVTFSAAQGPVHPTQLYDATAALVIAGILLWRFGRRRFDGENTALLLILYPIARSLTEVFRGDPERGTFGLLSTSQAISIPLLLLGIGLYLVRLRHASAATVPPDANDDAGPAADALEAKPAG